METYDLTIKRGDTFVLDFEYENADETPIDLTGFTVTFHVAEHAGATKVIDVSTSSGEIVITTNRVVVTLPKATTTALTAGTYVYDVQIESTNKETILTGKVTITDDI